MEESQEQDALQKQGENLGTISEPDDNLDIRRNSPVKDDKLTFFCDQTFDDYIEQFSTDNDCPLCVYQISDPKILEKHLRSAHLNHSICFIYNTVSYCCLPCRKMCLNPDKLGRQHRRSHFHCPSCKKIITRSKNFQQHVKTRIGKCSTNSANEFSKDNRKKSKKESELLTVVVNDHNFSRARNENSQTNRDGDIISASSDLSGDEEQQQSYPKRRKYWNDLPSHSNESYKDMHDADEMFLKSLLPEMRTICGERKLKLKMDMMHLLHNAAYRGDSSERRKISSRKTIF